MIELDILPKNEWAKYSERAFAVTFDFRRPATFDRIDFAIVARRNDRLLGFITCYEHDANTIYWQHGGMFPAGEKSVHTYVSFEAARKWCAHRYKHVFMRVENTNAPMMKLAMKLGFLVVGVRFYDDTVYVDLVLELEKPHE